MTDKKELTEVGRFCPNDNCESYALIDAGNIHKFGFTPQGRQRYRCKTCQQTFSENRGTLFYRRRVPASEILESLALLAKGSSMNAIKSSKGYKHETIGSWLLEAATHAQEVEAVLVQEYDVGPCEIDGLWSYVQHKGQKKAS
jgi:transposase-like protein